MIKNPLILRLISECINELDNENIINKFIIYKSYMKSWFNK
jgi:hypothetical protein